MVRKRPPSPSSAPESRTELVWKIPQTVRFPGPSSYLSHEDNTMISPCCFAGSSVKRESTHCWCSWSASSTDDAAWPFGQRSAPGSRWISPSFAMAAVARRPRPPPTSLEATSSQLGSAAAGRTQETPEPCSA